MDSFQRKLKCHSDQATALKFALQNNANLRRSTRLALLVRVQTDGRDMRACNLHRKNASQARTREAMRELVVIRKEGLYCVPGDFYIDPWRPVARAVITHAHADHARVGHGHYLAAAPGEGVLRARLGEITFQTLPYGEVIEHNCVTISFPPAGHFLGSSQVRMDI